jgi:glucose/mannose-6-phosphate isomerase
MPAANPAHQSQGAADAAILDDAAAMARLDPQGMLARVEGLPEQCEGARLACAGFKLPPGYSDPKEIVILGMGGSAIAGSVFRAVTARTTRSPVYVVRGYDLPAFAGEQTLVVACSHSGNTEETLSAFDQALVAGAMPVVVSTGGQLREIARRRGLPALGYQYDGEPRSAIGHQLLALIAIGERTNVLLDQARAVEEAVAALRALRERIGAQVPLKRNAAKQVAARLQGRLPVVVGAGLFSEAAYRWRTQFAENSKCWAVAEELPELGHNSIVGFGLPRELLPQLHVVFLSHPALPPTLVRHVGAIADELDLVGVSHELVDAEGERPLTQLLTAILFGDYVSYYLAMLYGVEPSPVAPIQRLKAKLAGG